MKAYLACILLAVLLITPVMASGGIDDTYTKLLLHLDNVTWVDEAGHGLTASGAPTANTVQKMFGVSSINLSQPASQSLRVTTASSEFNISTGNWTVDLWYRNTALNATAFQAIFVSSESHANPSIAILQAPGTSDVLVDFGDVGGISWLSTNNYLGTAPLNTWTHFAVQRGGNTFSMFKNGVLNSTYTNSSAIAGGNGTPGIGARYTVTTPQMFTNGQTDEVRFSVGVARYTGNFTPPTSEYRTTWNYSSSGTYYWLCPDDVTKIYVQLLGGGGGGAGGASLMKGLGGSAASPTRFSADVTPGTNYSISVGAGGAGALGSAEPPSHDGESSTGFDRIGAGGLGGTRFAFASPANGTPGANGTMGGTGDAGPGVQNDLGEYGGAAGVGHGAGGGGGATHYGGPPGDPTYFGAGGKGSTGLIMITNYDQYSGNVVDFVADRVTGTPGTLVKFTDLSEIADAAGLTYNWSFGDGTYSSVSGDVVHVFAYMGSFDVSLNVSVTSGSVIQTKTSYINIVSSDQTIFPTPHTVSITLVDYANTPMADVLITATPLNFTAPDSWVETYYGMSGVTINGTTLSGVTGFDGSWAAPMLAAYRYNFTFTKTGVIYPQNFTMYPSAESYTFRLPLISDVSPEVTPSSNYIIAEIANATVNSTAEFFNVTYRDTSGGTGVLTFNVSNATGAIIYTAQYNRTGLTNYTNLSSGALIHGLGTAYTARISAAHSQIGFVNKSVSTVWDAANPFAAYPSWVGQWLGIISLVVVGASASYFSVKYVAIILPVLAYFEVTYMHLLAPAVGVPAFTASLGVLLTFAALKYIRDSKNKLGG